NNANFRNITSKYSPLLVYFHVNWSNQCKELILEFIKAARILEKDKVKVYLAKLDAGENSNKQLVDKYKVYTYPTLLYF
ncbi:thioredoxin domain-containing protein, partial [Escherichia coli]|uniref:thioredoxin domain-containing protein n=1 Tax=Escherichia coli TaxID=562 RepID=UPI00135D5C82